MDVEPSMLEKWSSMQRVFAPKTEKIPAVVAKTADVPIPLEMVEQEHTNVSALEPDFPHEEV